MNTPPEKQTIGQRRRARAHAARPVTGMMRRKRSAPPGSIKDAMEVAWQRKMVRVCQDRAAKVEDGQHHYMNMARGWAESADALFARLTKQMMAEVLK